MKLYYSIIAMISWTSFLLSVYNCYTNMHKCFAGKYVSALNVCA